VASDRLPPVFFDVAGWRRQVEAWYTASCSHQQQQQQWRQPDVKTRQAEEQWQRPSWGGIWRRETLATSSTTAGWSATMRRFLAPLCCRSVSPDVWPTNLLDDRRGTGPLFRTALFRRYEGLKLAGLAGWGLRVRIRDRTVGIANFRNSGFSE